MTTQEPCSIKQAFDNDIAKHTMTILRDTDGGRHLQFSYNGGSNNAFDLITYKNGLMIRGDMGCYVFEHYAVVDMFKFFNQANGNIKPQYWGQKLQASDEGNGFKKFSWDKFKIAVLETMESWIEGLTDEDEHAVDIAELTHDLREYVDLELSICDGDEHESIVMIRKFDYKGFEFTDFFDSKETDEYSYHYIWCLHAIVWGIQQYHLELKGDAG